MHKDLLLRALKATSVTCSRVICAIEATCVFLPLETKTHLHRTCSHSASSLFITKIISRFEKENGSGKELTQSDVTLLYVRDHAECGWMSPRVWPSLSSLLGLLQGAQRWPSSVPPSGEFLSGPLFVNPFFSASSLLSPAALPPSTCLPVLHYSPAVWQQCLMCSNIERSLI